jgi:signal transduction histidine kinase
MTLPRQLVGATAAAVALGLVATVIWALGGDLDAYFWPRWVWFALGIPVALAWGVRWAWAKPPGRPRRLAVHAAISVVLGLIEVFAWLFTGLGLFWPIFPIAVLGALYAAHVWLLPRLAPDRELALMERISNLTRSRSGALDIQAAEMRRIERDLHDGAQARIVSLGMSLGLAARLVKTDPDAAADLINEARASTVAALDQLRDVVHGIHPPVLADRGLGGAVEALALDVSVPVTVTAALPNRLPAPVESAVYFATAECLANVVKHSGATRAWVDLTYRGGRLIVVVGDNGSGGAQLGSGPAGRGGTGLTGIVRRLEAFDGTVTLDSPAGGPTTVTMEVPCASS